MNRSGEAYIITCSHCGVANRLSQERTHASRQAICGKCKSPLVGAQPLTITDWNFATEVEQSSLPVLLDLWAPWCGPCHMVAPIIEELAAELAGRVRVGKLNTDENPITASRFQVRSIPTLLLLQGGREVQRLVGAQPKQQILNALRPFL